MGSFFPASLGKRPKYSAESCLFSTSKSASAVVDGFSSFAGSCHSGGRCRERSCDNRCRTAVPSNLPAYACISWSMRAQKASRFASDCRKVSTCSLVRRLSTGYAILPLDISAKLVIGTRFFSAMAARMPAHEVVRVANSFLMPSSNPTNAFSKLLAYGR